jgi:hypothetical protein
MSSSTTITTNTNGYTSAQAFNKNKKLLNQHKNDTTSSATSTGSSEESSSDPLESDFEDVEEDLPKDRDTTAMTKKKVYHLDDFQILKTIGEYEYCSKIYN